MDYEKEYMKTCDTLNNMIKTKWPASIKCGIFEWARENAPDLYKEEEGLDIKINTQWAGSIDFGLFKKTVLEWGRAVLKIYKKHSEIEAICK